MLRETGKRIVYDVAVAMGMVFVLSRVNTAHVTPLQQVLRAKSLFDVLVRIAQNRPFFPCPHQGFFKKRNAGP